MEMTNLFKVLKSFINRQDDEVLNSSEHPHQRYLIFQMQKRGKGVMTQFSGTNSYLMRSSIDVAWQQSDHGSVRVRQRGQCEAMRGHLRHLASISGLHLGHRGHHGSRVAPGALLSLGAALHAVTKPVCRAAVLTLVEVPLHVPAAGESLSRKIN